MIDKVEFAKIITGLSANFGAKIPEGLLEVWHIAFTEDKMSLDQIRYAASRIIRSKKDGYGRMPTYAEFIEFIQGNKEDKALVIANNIISHLKTHGSRVFPKLDDPIAKHLMTKRWPYYEFAAAVIENELKWWAKEFCEAHRSYTALEVPMEIAAAKEAVKKLVSGIGK